MKMLMSSSKPSSIVLSVFLLFLFQYSSSDNLIQDSCMDASKADPTNINYDFCVAYLEPASEGQVLTTLQNLTSLSLKQAMSNATDVMGVSYDLSLNKQHNLSEQAIICLKSCSNYYAHAFGILSDARIAFNGNLLDNATRGVNYALDASTTCEDGFKERGETPLITNYNDAYFQDLKISLAFIEMCRHLA